MAEKFHKYLYKLTFDVYTDNNPLTYVLTMARPDAPSHQWLAILTNYNFQLYYRAVQTNFDADALLRVSCLGCIPDALGTHLQCKPCRRPPSKAPQVPSKHTVAICRSWTLSRSLQVACMTIDDWHHAQ